MRIDTVVFFRPEEIAREASCIPVELYNDCCRALARSITDCAFVPVRNMQLLAVITRDEVIFVDSLNYAVQAGRGGRLIMLAWDFPEAGKRESLDAPVPVEIISFHKDSPDLHSRLMSEFPAALATQEKYERSDSARTGMAEIIPFRRPD